MMKASEAEPLSTEELQVLKSLFQRWVLCRYPFYRGSSEESDAFQTYYSVAVDAARGHVPLRELDEEKYRETSLDE
jgi:hypothetical protein